MDLDTLRRNATLVYGGIVAILWVTVQGPVATTVTVVGAILLGLSYTFGGRGEGRERDRSRHREEPPA